MVLTASQTAAFFEHEDQMGIPRETVLQLALEGIVSVTDLAEFNRDSIQRLADNLRVPGGRVPDPNPNAQRGATIPTPSFILSAKSYRRLQVATNLVKYYNDTGRELTAENLQWNHVMKNFEVQWNALLYKKNARPPDVPKINETLPGIEWMEAFKIFLSRVVGVRTIPLCYVIRDEVKVPVVTPPLAPNQPYSNEHGSLQRELIARSSHAHDLFFDDNASVYHYLEEATRSTSYSDFVHLFKSNRDGRGVWFALVRQFASARKCHDEIYQQDRFLRTSTWNDHNNILLESFISQHRNAFVSMQLCAQYVQDQLPDEHSRVRFLLDAIRSSDPRLEAAMSRVHADEGSNGMRNDFEAAAAQLVPFDPVARRHRVAGSKRGQSLNSGTEKGRRSFKRKKKKESALCMDENQILQAEETEEVPSWVG